jgi:hypothetical protein
MRFYSFSLRTISLGLLALVLAAGAHAETIYGITGSASDASFGDKLVRFDSATPNNVITVGTFTGTTGFQVVRSIDFHPFTNQLYAISTSLTAPNVAQLYTVNLSNAVLTKVGPEFSLGTNTNQYVEMEFNPVTGTIRILTGENEQSGRQNNFELTLSPFGAVTQTTLNYDPSDPDKVNFDNNQIMASAFTNPSAGQTTLYAWDWGGFDSLVTVGNVNGTPNPPSSGLLFNVQTPVLPRTSSQGRAIGMDISPNGPAPGVLYTTHDAPGASGTMGLYIRSLDTCPPADCAAVETLIGNYPATTFVLDISVRKTSTAAEVSVTGKVVTPTGRGLTRALVTLTDGQGLTQTVSTGRGGTFTFNGVESSRTYFITVDSEQYSYDPQFVQVNDSVTGLRIAPSSN